MVSMTLEEAVEAVANALNSSIGGLAVLLVIVILTVGLLYLAMYRKSPLINVAIVLVMIGWIFWLGGQEIEGVIFFQGMCSAIIGWSLIEVARIRNWR